MVSIWMGTIFAMECIWIFFLTSDVYEWGWVRGLQPHIRTQNHGKLPPPPPRWCVWFISNDDVSDKAVKFDVRVFLDHIANIDYWNQKEVYVAINFHSTFRLETTNQRLCHNKTIANMKLHVFLSAMITISVTCSNYPKTKVSNTV